MCEFKHTTEKVGLKIHQGKTKILSNQSSSRRNEMVIDNIKVEILTKEESTKYLGQVVTFQNRRQSSSRIESGLPGRRSELTSKYYLLRHRLRLFDMVMTPTIRLRNMDPLERTRKNDSIDAAQNAPPHHANKRKIQEEETGQK